MLVPSPVYGPVYMESVKEAALTILRAAVAAANEDEESTSPFKGLNIPPHRFASVPDEAWPLLEAHVGDDEGRSTSRAYPEFDFVADLVLDGLVATGRDDAADLDARASRLVQAICDTLLEHAGFQAMFSRVTGLRRQREDAAAQGRGGQFDAVLFRITITVGFRETYAPPEVAPAETTMDLGADLGPSPAVDDPDARLIVREQFRTEP
jgi:hypothetical protein